MIDMKVDRTMNCELFNSCKKTKYASQVVAMSNAIGFTTFQGTEAYRKSPVFINMNFTKNEGLNYPIDTCDTEPVNNQIRGFPVLEKCVCNSCDKSCHFDLETTMPIMKGFSLTTVGLVYLAVFIFTGIIYGYRIFYRKHHEESSRSNTIESDNSNDNKNHSNNSSKTLNSNNTGNNINNTKERITNNI